MKLIMVSLVLCLSTFSSLQVRASKIACQSYYQALLKIQSQQRSGHSIKEGERLAKKEKQAWNKWWNCKQGKLLVKKAAKKTTQSSIKTSVKITGNKSASKKKYQGNSHAALSSKNVKPFHTNQPIIFKSDFSGDKLAHWLNFYTQPSQCIKPKSYKVFVWCVEDKSTQKKAFAADYATKAFKK